MTQPRFITVEGIEGVGKSTQCIRLAEALEQALGKPVLRTREPGGTELGEALRGVLLDPNIPAMSDLAELLLMFAARAEHLRRVIEPALGAGTWVVCDRFTDATYAYQGGGRGVSPNDIAALETLVQGSRQPDLTLLLDMDVTTALRRVASRGPSDRFESERQSFFERVREAYRARAEQCPERIHVVSATGSEAEVQALLWQAVSAFLT